MRAPARCSTCLRAVQARDLAAVQGAQSTASSLVAIRSMRCLSQRFFGGVGVRRLHRRRGGVDVAVAPGDVGAQKCLGVVLDLLLHGLVGLAELEHHVGRAGIGSGRHGRDVGGLQQEKAGRAGARPGGAT